MVNTGEFIILEHPRGDRLAFVCQACSLAVMLPANSRGEVIHCGGRIELCGGGRLPRIKYSRDWFHRALCGRAQELAHEWPAPIQEREGLVSYSPSDPHDWRSR